MNKKDMFYRNVVIDNDVIDVDMRTVKVAFSSEEPYLRYYGYEILSHKADEVDLSFLEGRTAPLLLDHDPEKQIGVVESVKIEDGIGRASVRFSKNGLGAEIFEDVVDGIRQNISVGYVVKSKEKTGKKIEDIDAYVCRWNPFEISIVSIPADKTVGVGREEEVQEETTIKKEIEMTIKQEEVKQENVDTDAIRSEARKEELKRVREVDAIGRKFGMEDLARSAIDNGTDVESFRVQVLDKMEAPSAVKTQEKGDIGLSEKEQKSYSLMRALRAVAYPDNKQFQKEAGFELEASQAAADKAGVQARGVMVPYDILTRDLTVGTDTAGGHLVDTDLRPQNFIELLRNKMIVQQLGARVISGLSGNVAFPRQTGAGTAYWVTEGNAPTESQQAVDQVAMTPKTVAAYTDYSRQLMLQSSIDVESFVINDLSSVLAIEMDRAALYGSGAAGQPTGIANTSGINAPTAFAAAVPTFAEMVAMETAVSVDNADIGTLAYLTDPTTRGGLKTTSKAGTEAIFVWDNNEVNGYRAAASNQVVAGDVFYGNWADLLIGLWSGLDITIDPYSLSTSGGKRIVAFQTTDIAVRHPVSFAHNNDGV